MPPTPLDSGLKSVRFFKSISQLALIGSLMVALPVRLAQACGPSQDLGFHGYSFMNPEIITKQDSITNFFIQFEDLVKSGFPEEETRIKDNLSEWQASICEEATVNDIRRVIYDSDPEQLNLLRTAIISKSQPLPFRLQGNTFASFLKQNQCKETIDYLLFAKACEPFVGAKDPWKKEKKNPPKMLELIEQGRQEFKKTESHYIRLRYAYQIVRLAHYAGEYEMALSLFDYLEPKIDIPSFGEEGHKEKSLIYYWLLGHRAGALRALEKRVEASYWYGIIFAKCPSRREAAFQSFLLRDDAEWEACLLLCKTDVERAMLFAIRAYEKDSRAMEEIQEIYALDPQSVFLEMLLIKEIRELERDLLGVEFNDHRSENQRYHRRPRSDAGEYVIELQDLARKFWEEKQVKRPKLWQMAEGYLELIAGDYYAASQTLREVQKFTTNPQMEEQIEVLLLAAQIGGFGEPTDSIERIAYDIRKGNEWYLKYASLPDFMRDKFTAMYEEMNRPGKAFRCQHELSELRPNPQDKIILDLMKIFQESTPSPLEELFAENPDGSSIKNDLHDMRAILYMHDNNFEAAFEEYREIPRTRWGDYGVFDPFRATLKDCISCPHSKDSIDLYTRGAVIERILDLQYQIRARPDSNAVFYLEIGVALYNMTYFGHSWNVMDYYRSGASWRYLGSGRNVFPLYGSPFGNKENFNVDLALYYFEKARLAAKSDELAAKAAYMGAKCELVKFYQSEAYEPPPCCNRIPYIPEAYSENYKRLQDYYSETNFYQSLIEECLYFRAYALRQN